MLPWLTLLFFHFGLTFLLPSTFISDSRHHSRNAVILLGCRLISGSHRWRWSGGHSGVWWCTGCSLLVLAHAECSAMVILGCFTTTRPTNCVNRRSNSGHCRSQRRSADSLDSARRLVHATPPPKRACSALWWSAGWIIWLVTGRYLALHQPPWLLFDCQNSSFSAGAQAAVQRSDNRRLVDGWSDEPEPREHFFLGRVNLDQGFRLETDNKTGLHLLRNHGSFCRNPSAWTMSRRKEAMVGLSLSTSITKHV